MAAPLLLRRQQLCVLSGTEGTAPTWSNVEDAANATTLLYNAQFTPNIERFQRQPYRAQIGTLDSIPTIKVGTITLRCELKGSGTAGSAPEYDLLLQACGMDKTTNSGTASIGTVTKASQSTGSGAVPVLTGTFTGTKSGRLELLITDVTTDTSIDVQATFYPADGTAPATANFTQNSATAVALTAVAAGVSFDFGDPSTSTTGYVEGDLFVAKLVSDQEVSVEYTMRDPTGSSDPIVDLSLIQDGRAHRLYSCRGNFTLSGNVGEIGFIDFEFQGVYAATADKTILSGINYNDTVPPAFLGLTNYELLGDTSFCFNSFSIESGNTLALRRCATNSNGVESARITSRAMTGSIDPEADLVANFDAFGKLRSGATGALDFQLGSTSGNIVTVACPRAQITDVGQGERDDYMVDNISLQLNQPYYSASSDYTEMTLTFK